MKNKMLRVSLLLATLLAVAWIVQAGSLEPPGPPAPTMKPLDQVEPRIPLSNAAFSIPASGSYYLTEDISSGVGLTIDADDVTLDLKGFSITGVDSPTVPGIAIDGAVNVVIHDGTIQGFASGVHLAGAQGTLSRLRIRGNTGVGVRITSSDARVEGCDISSNGTEGINIAFDELIYDFGTAEIINNSITANGTNGILADSAFLLVQQNRVHMNLADGIGISMADAQVLNNVVTSNNDNGIRMSLASGSIAGNRCFSNGGVGINVTDSSVSQQVSKNVASNNILADYSLDPASSSAPISTLSGSPGAWDNIALTVPAR